MSLVASRRAVGGLLVALLAQRPPPPATAKGSAPPSVQALLEVMLSVDGLLADRATWKQAESQLEGLSEESLARAFDAAIEPPTAKDRLMDQAAFIVYYEERRYGDLRLEPQTPSRRAEQNGLKKSALRAIADERAELKYLLSAPTDEDASDLQRYSRDACAAISKFLEQ